MNKIIIDSTPTLHSLMEGDFARVSQLLCKGSIRRRLQDLGLVNGTLVKCVRRSAHGDPIAYLIRGAVIALRCEDSKSILI